MKIESSTVDAHRFARVRRRGYDPVEVDRVMERLVATLRSYEDDTARLESRVREADHSVDAIRRTFAAAQRTRDEMIGEGADRAAVIVERARSESERLVRNARTEIEAMSFERDEEMVRAHRVGAARMAEAEAMSYRMLLDAETARSRAVSAAESAIEDSRREGEARKQELVEEAERHANEIVGAARREEIRLTTHLDRLREAIADVETRIKDLAELATPHTNRIARIIDLTTVDGGTLMTGSGRS
jgi:DivIVA domain-containing protein